MHKHLGRAANGSATVPKRPWASFMAPIQSAYNFPACEVAALIRVGAQFGTNVVDHYSHIKMTNKLFKPRKLNPLI